MNTKAWILPVLSALLFADTVLAATLYENDFEALGKLNFRGSFGPRWIGDLKTAERQGHVKIHRKGLCEQGEKSHSGVMSYVLDLTVDKSTGKWGGTCMFQSPALRISLDKPVYLTGYVYPEVLPPDIVLSLGVIFETTDPKTGRRSSGSLRLPRRGIDPEGWMVFSEDVSKLVTGRFPGAVMTGWMIDIHSNRAFHGQRVKLYLDDITVTDSLPSVNVTGDGVVRGHDILSRNPYEVSYLHETMRKFAELIRKYNRGKNKKIFGTEGGCAASDVLYYDDINSESLFYDRYVTELEQAEYIVRSNILMFAGGMFQKNAIFYPYNGKVSSRNSMYHFVIADNGIYPKTVFPATANMIGRLSGAVPEGEFEQRDANGLQGYYFRKNGTLFAVLWIYRPDHRTREAVLPLSMDRVQAYNLVGEPIRLRGGANTLLTLSEGALYLYPKNVPEAEFIAALKNIKVENPTVSLKIGKNGSLTAEVFNDTSSELTGTLTLSPSRMSRDFQLPPGGKCSFDFPWNNRTSLTAYQAEIQVDGERLRSNEIRPLFCGKAERRPRIDGNLEEFRHLPGIRLGAAQQISLYQAKIRNSADLGAVVYFQYDDSFFYIAAEVVDDLHQVPHEQPNMYWANDALQLLFVMSGKRSKLSSRDLLELAVTGTKQGGRISTTLLEQKLDFSRAEVAVVRRNGKTFYELALPWETLSKGFRPDNSVNPGFNLAVSDNDGNPEISRMPKLKGYEKSLQMSRGLVDSKDPSSALILFFEQK